jgi:hypothetical protein
MRGLEITCNETLKDRADDFAYDISVKRIGIQLEEKLELSPFPDSGSAAMFVNQVIYLPTHRSANQPI